MWSAPAGGWRNLPLGLTAHGGQGGRPLHPCHHHGEPLQAGNEYRRSSRRIVVAGLDGALGVPPCWSGPGQVPPGRYIPASPARFRPRWPGPTRSAPQLGNFLVRPLPEKPLQERVPHLGERSRLLSRLVPAGAWAGESTWAPNSLRSNPDREWRRRTMAARARKRCAPDAGLSAGPAIPPRDQ